MTKGKIARELYVIAVLLEIEGANSFKVRAYKKAADALRMSPLSLEEIMSQPSSLPGIGKETGTLVHSLHKVGLLRTLKKLNISLPYTVEELTHVPGIGPKKAYEIYQNHEIKSLADLQKALDGNQLTGFSTNKLQRMKRDVRVLIKRQTTFPIALAWPFALQVKDILEDIPNVTRVAITGEARRLVPMCRRLEFVLALLDDGAFREWCTKHNGRWDSDHANLTLETSFGEKIEVSIHPASDDEFAALLLKATGDELHQGVMEELLREGGYSWSNHSITDSTGDAVPIQTEADIYGLIHLPFFPPETREGHGLLQDPKQFVQRADIRGDLHVHSVWSDGSLSIEEIIQAAELLGYEYIAITDHSQSLTIAGGLTPERLNEQRLEIERLRPTTRVHILHGIEVDILSDGRLDLPDDSLSNLDVVIASVHRSMQQSKSQMTQRILRAIQHPSVDIIGHLTGRILGRRSGYELDLEQICREAEKYGVALELNANPNRLDISETLLRRALPMGVMTAINTDSHHIREFAYMDYGIRMAHRGWVGRKQVLNTLSYKELVKRLHGYRNPPGDH